MPWSSIHDENYNPKLIAEDILNVNKIGPTCIIGDEFKCQEKNTIKKTIIGNHCKIGSNCIISNCIIMNHVYIDDNCILNNCIISNGVRILRDSKLKECKVASQAVIPNNSNYEYDDILNEKDEKGVY